MVQLEDQADEYSRSSLLFPLLFSLPFFLFLPLLSLLSRRSTSVLAREPEKPEVEWHKIGRKKWGEKGKRRKESRGTPKAKPPINFSLTTISTHNSVCRKSCPRGDLDPWLHLLFRLSSATTHCVKIKIGEGWGRSKKRRDLC